MVKLSHAHALVISERYDGRTARLCLRLCRAPWNTRTNTTTDMISGCSRAAGALLTSAQLGAALVAVAHERFLQIVLRSVHINDHSNAYAVSPAGQGS